MRVPVRDKCHSFTAQRDESPHADSEATGSQLLRSACNAGESTTCEEYRLMTPSESPSIVNSDSLCLLSPSIARAHIASALQSTTSCFEGVRAPHTFMPAWLPIHGLCL
eukprot:GHVU01179349.1.p2 GENE.GHVU01179349.1~~GHVU01179349.1.p2  ORF type:complete len:109 (-),score=4.07 GHVU01179349.1:34-360(-)